MFLVAKEVMGGFLYGFAVDSPEPANRIYGFRVNEMTGELSPLPGFPVATQGRGGGVSNVPGSGSQPESFKVLIGPYSARMFALNNDGCEGYGCDFSSANVSVYDVDLWTGQLHETSFSPIPLPYGYWSCLAIHQSGSPLVVGDVGQTPDYGSAYEGYFDRNRVVSLQITETNAVPAPGSPYSTMVGTNAAATPYSCTFSADGCYLYTGGALGPLFAGFAVDRSTGALTPLPGSPYDSGYWFPSGFATDEAGRLFMVQSADPIAQVFNLQDGVPVAVADNPFLRASDWAAVALLHPAGYYISAGPDLATLSVLRVTGARPHTRLEWAGGWNGYAYCELIPCTMPSLAINVNGNHVYVGYNAFNDYIEDWHFDIQTGQVTYNNNFGRGFLPWNGRISALAYVPGPGRSDLAVTRTDSPQPVIVKGELTTVLTITNRGPDAAGDVIVSNAIPSRTQVISITSSQGSCVLRKDIVFCNLGSLPAFSSAMVTLLTSPLAATNIESSVKVVAGNIDPDYANNVQTVPIVVRGQTYADLECSVNGFRKCRDVEHTYNCGLRATLVVTNTGI